MLGAEALIGEACDQTGLGDFGAAGWRERLERLVASLDTEASITESGEQIMQLRIGMLLANRLRIVDVLDAHPEVADEEIEGPPW